MSFSPINFQIAPPAYYDFEGHAKHIKKDSIVSRIFYATLPFIALHKPFGRIVTLTSNTLNTISSFSELAQQRNFKELFKTTFATFSLAATYFMHPVGLVVSALYEFGYDISDVILNLQTGHFDQVFLSLFSMTQNMFYLATMFTSSLEIIAISLLVNMAIEIIRSRKEFLKEKWIECASHLLMSLVRFSQAAPYIEKVAYKHDVKGKELVHSLAETIAKVRNKASYYLFLTSRFFVKAHWKITEMWIKTISLCNDTHSVLRQKILSITKSSFSALSLLPFAISGLIAGQICHFSAFLLSNTPYIHLQGKCKEKKLDKKFSFFQLNCGLTAGGFSDFFSGTKLANSERTAKIAKIIKAQNPDLVCLQEVSDIEESQRLFTELSDTYRDFYFHMGATPFIIQNDSGLFVASKESLQNAELHSFSDIEGTESMVNKCFFMFSTRGADFITTHLSPSHDDLNPQNSEIEVRREEQKRILLALENRASKNPRPVFVSGDFNINWGRAEHQQSPLFNQGKDSYNQGRRFVLDQDATAETNYLIQRNWHHNENAKPDRLILDYFLAFFYKGEVKSRKIATFDTKNPENCFSDHSGLYLEIS